MLVYNMIFNVLISLCGFSGYFSQNPKLYLLTANRMSIIYFTTDILTEILVYNRYTYIPHHVLSITLINSIQLQFNTRYILLIYFFAESSSFISNFRQELKEKKKLTSNMDILFFIYYFMSRNIFLPVLVYQFKEYKTLIFLSFMIQNMSYFWTFKWINSILKYRRKLR